MSDEIRQRLTGEVAGVVERLLEDWSVTVDPQPEVVLERPREAAHGDYASNIAMRLAKPCRRPPRDIAAALVERLARGDFPARVEIAGPGFINFHLEPEAQLGIIARILEQKHLYGRRAPGSGPRVHVEFCSANPTGPLHVGHGRGAAYGMALANVLEASGCEVFREYYVNDAGRQIDILATSAWLRALIGAGVSIAFPVKAYQGGYVDALGSALPWLSEAVPAELTVPQPPGVDDEELLDQWLARCRHTLGDTRYRELQAHVVERIRAGIETDLAAFGVHYDGWFSERSLFENGVVDAVIEALANRHLVYERDGALWFAAARFGDEKDRVVIRENGIPTYFASDIAYHFDKFKRKFDRIIDVWGADHHGYIPRIAGALSALELPAENFEVLLVQFATLMRGSEKLQMSTRSGEFVELKELIDEVGADAARYFYVTRKSEQHLEFDLELAKAESKDNPVYYIQYAHARICSVFRELTERGLAFSEDAAHPFERLDTAREIELTKMLDRFPEVLGQAAERREPHLVANYLRDLAHQFHSYYNDCRILVDDAAVRAARLALLTACRYVFGAGLGILGVSAPERM